MPLVKSTPRLINFVPVGFVVIPAKAVSMEAEKLDEFPLMTFDEDSKSYGLPFVDIPA